MYRVAQNTALNNSKRFKEARVNPSTKDSGENDEAYYERPPLYLDLHYMIAVHSKFRSDAERLMGWLMLRLHEATHLVYRPRRYTLPNGRQIDSKGRDWNPQTFDEEVIMEKVSLALVDDLTVGDAINLFTLHEAPYRPFLTYRARVALDGPLYKSSGGSQIKLPRLERTSPPSNASGAASSPNGRVRAGQAVPNIKTPPGPKPYMLRKNADADTDSED
jgi:hypothetical protein